MANPLNELRWEDAEGLRKTFWIDNSTIVWSKTADNGSVAVDLAVTKVPGTAFTVKLSGDGESVLGKLINVDDDGACTVQVTGAVTLPAGTAAPLGDGNRICGDLLVAAPGYIRAVNSATAAELALAGGRIVEDADTTKVWVLL